MNSASDPATSMTRALRRNLRAGRVIVAVAADVSRILGDFC